MFLRKVNITTATIILKLDIFQKTFVAFTVCSQLLDFSPSVHDFPLLNLLLNRVFTQTLRSITQTIAKQLLHIENGRNYDKYHSTDAQKRIHRFCWGALWSTGYSRKRFRWASLMDWSPMKRPTLHFINNWTL